MYISTPTLILEGSVIVTLFQRLGDEGEVFSLHVTDTEDYPTRVVIMGTQAQVTQFAAQLLAAVRA